MMTAYLSIDAIDDLCAMVVENTLDIKQYTQEFHLINVLNSTQITDFLDRSTRAMECYPLTFTNA